jgi:hypothetical protein
MKTSTLSSMLGCSTALFALAAPALAQDPSAPIAPLDPNAAPGAPAAPAAPAASPAPAASADAEAEALALALAQDSGSDAANAAVADVEEFKLNIYGFTDFTFTAMTNEFAFGNPYSTFMVGNVNLYVGADLGSGWRALTEFRLLYMPNGNIPADQFLAAAPVRTDTTVTDPADFGRPQRWGGVEIERAWIEYSAHPLLTIQAGQWLTPYGIWNVDHGTPVIIGVRRPYVVGEGLIPERQTGVQIYGAYLAGTTEIKYHLALSNGKGPTDAYQDLDKNKAFTGRLQISNESPIGTFTLGGTVFTGRFTDRFSRFYVSPTGQLGTEWISRARYDELGIAADLRWVWNDLTLQGEFINRDTIYGDFPTRPVPLPLPGAPNGFIPDYRSTGWYVMGAYRLPWLNVMPFFGGESYHSGQASIGDAGAIWGGLNVRPIPRVVLKFQFTQSFFLDDTSFVGDNGFQGIDFQAAWSF